MSDVVEPVRFYFSFRSPYSWLAFVRAPRALDGLPVRIEYLPVFPPPDFPNDPAAVPNKLKYILQDVTRIAEAWGMSTMPPASVDTAWERPHAAFVYAQDQGRGYDFALELFSARFQRAQDVGADSVMQEVATKVGLDPAGLLAAADDVAYQTRVVEGMIKAATEDSIFGVPLFVYRGEPFWGNDRIEWLLRAIRSAHGLPITDLRADFMRPVLP
jgi:2-hydroxychromene-2-carboxylate isomerase